MDRVMQPPQDQMICLHADMRVVCRLFWELMADVQLRLLKTAVCPAIAAVSLGSGDQPAESVNRAGDVV